MDVAATIVAALIALIAGFLGGWLLRGHGEHSSAPSPAQLAAQQQSAVQHELELTRALAARDAEHAAVLVREAETRAALQAELAGLDSTVDELRAQLDAASTQRQELVSQHRADQAERVEKERREQAVLQALSPVRETLTAMQQKVSELERERTLQYGSLAEQLKQAQQADEQLRVTTESLASARTAPAASGARRSCGALSRPQGWPDTSTSIPRPRSPPRPAQADPTW